MEPTAEKGEERPTGQEQGEIKTEVDLCLSATAGVAIGLPLTDQLL